MVDRGLAGGVPRVLDRFDEGLHVRSAGMAHRSLVGREVDVGFLDALLPTEGFLYASHAGRAGHPLDVELRFF